MDIGIDLLQWLYVVIIAPVLGWLGGWFQSWSGKRRKTKALVAYLAGFPPEAKAKLVEFYYHRAHTLRGNPMDPVVRLLVRRQVLSVGPGGGTYDAVDSYLTIRSDVWEVMNNWMVDDLVAIQLLEEFLDKIKHDESSNDA